MWRYYSRGTHWVKLRNASLFIVYVTLTILATPRFLSLPLQLSFFVYALFVFGVVWKSLMSPSVEPSKPTPNTPDTKFSQKFFLYLLIFSGIFLVATRLYLFARYGEAPLGYDTGFYLKFVGPWGFANKPLPTFLHWAPLYVLGISPITILHWVYILLQFLIAGALYTLTRTLTPTSRLSYAAVAVFLFSISLTQFFAFWWMFYNTMLALAFLLLTMALLHRKSLLAVFTGGFGAAIHPPTFLPLGLTFFFFTIFQIVRSALARKWPSKETWIIISLGVLMLAWGMTVGRNGIITGFGYLLRHKFLSINFPALEIEQAKGLFIDFKMFHLTNIWILPFTILGLLSSLYQACLRRQHSSSPRSLFMGILFFVLFLLAYFPFVYQHRFSILLDLMIIWFAVRPLTHFLQSCSSYSTGHIMNALLVGGLVLNTSLIVWHQEPQLFPEELENIKDIATLAEPNAYAMSLDGLYAPWVYAFSNRPTITPGYLNWDQWNLSKWAEFWHGKSNARRHELLKTYSQPLYIFIGKRLNLELPYQKFIRNDPHFKNINPQVWKYDSSNITTEEIDTMRKKEQNSNH